MKIITEPATARAVLPRPAATTLLVRDAPAGLEVLMVRRSLQATFMPGAYVFPGGAVDAADGAAECAGLCDESAPALTARIGAVTGTGTLAAAFAVAALRECFEECGLWLSASAHLPAHGERLPSLRARLHGGEAFAAVASAAHAAGWPLATSVLLPWSHWVTPLGLPKRFDTLFFVAEAPPAQVPSVDEGETTTLAWVHPPAALAAHARGGFPMEFATVATVRSLAPFAQQGVAALAAHARSQRALPPQQPRLHLGAGGELVAIVLPGEPGYDEAALR